MRLGVAIALAIAAVDQVSKAWIIATLVEPGRGFAVTEFFNLVYVRNQGLSFGLLRHDAWWGPWLFAAIGVAMSVFLVMWLRTIRWWPARAAIGLILGGAIGNIADRVTRGAVVDFLDFHWGGYHWWAFNVADSAISVGVGVLIVVTLFGPPERPTT